MQSISDIQLDELDQTTIIVRGDWLIEKESVIMHIHDQGSWQSVILTTTLGSWRHPPVMQADLVKLLPALFIKDILDSYRNHVAKHWNQDTIDLIEIQHCELIVVYGRVPDVKATLDSHDEKTYFNDA
ncbi:hypothetical protein BASA61_004949 [Batrachochytrium salamandrivorans]|nr:hypothetical protein BASA61_004949 [Batrachochytrium salamandrivorans]